MASGENAGTEAANGEGLNVTTEQAFTFTMLRAMQLMFIMGTEQPKAETQEHVHETIRALWAFRKAGHQFHEENPNGDVQEGFVRACEKLLGGR